MTKAAPIDFLPDLHTIAFGHSLGRDVFGADERDEAFGWKMRESPFAAGDGGFGCQTLSPKIAAQVIADFVEPFPFYLLTNDPAVSDHFSGRFQSHGPEAYAVVDIAAAVALDPLRHAGAIKGRGIVAHGLRVGENLGQRFGIFGDEFAQDQAGGF